MITPKCPDPGCKGKTFQVTKVKPKNSKLKASIIHCSKCGCSIGVVDNAGIFLERIVRKFNIKV